MNGDEEVFAGMSVGEVLALCAVAVFVGPGILLVASGKWAAAAGWAVAHGVLAPAAAEPVLTVPGAGGAGLDTARLLVVAVGIVAVVALGAYGIWLRRRYRLNRLVRRGLV